MTGIEEMIGVHLVMTGIEEMIGAHLDMIGIDEMTEGMNGEMTEAMTGIDEMTGAPHPDMIVTGKMTEALLGITVTEEMKEVLIVGVGEMIAMDVSQPEMIMTTEMTVQDHQGTREQLLSQHR